MLCYLIWRKIPEYAAAKRPYWVSRHEYLKHVKNAPVSYQPVAVRDDKSKIILTEEFYVTFDKNAQEKTVKKNKKEIQRFIDKGYQFFALKEESYNELLKCKSYSEFIVKKL